MRICKERSRAGSVGARGARVGVLFLLAATGPGCMREACERTGTVASSAGADPSYSSALRARAVVDAAMASFPAGTLPTEGTILRCRGVRAAAGHLPRPGDVREIRVDGRYARAPPGRLVAIEALQEGADHELDRTVVGDGVLFRREDEQIDRGPFDGRAIARAELELAALLPPAMLAAAARTAAALRWLGEGIEDGEPVD